MKMLIETMKVDFKLQLRDFVVLFYSLIFPSLMLLIFGGMYGNLPSPFYGGFGTVDVMVPSFVGIVVAGNGIMNLPLTLVEYRDKKILKRLMATPLKPVYIIISQLVVNLIITIIGFLIVAVFGKLIFNLHFYGNVLLFIVAFLISTLSIFSIGFLIASFIRNSRVATTVANIIYFPMLFLSGATLPLETMPKFMLGIAKAVPLTYAVDLIKRTWLSSDIAWLDMGLSLSIDIFLLCAVTVVCFIISITQFKWYYD